MLLCSQSFQNFCAFYRFLGIANECMFSKRDVLGSVFVDHQYRNRILTFYFVQWNYRTLYLFPISSNEFNVS